MPAGDKLIKEFGRLLKAYNLARKTKSVRIRADARRALFRHNEKIAKYKKGLTDPTEQAAFFMKQIEAEELARPVTDMKRLKNVRQFLGQVEGGAKLEGGTLRTPAKFPWEMPTKPKLGDITAARRGKEADRMMKVMEDAKMGAAHYESPSTKHLRKMFTKDANRAARKRLEKAGGRAIKFKPGDKVTIKPLMWQGEAYLPGIPERWMKRYLHYFGKEKPTPAQLEKATKGIPRQIREDFGADVAKEYKAAHAYFSQEDAFEGIWRGLAITGEKLRKMGKDPAKFRHLKRVKSVFPVGAGGIGGVGLARPKVPRVRAEEKGGEIPFEMPETGASLRDVFPKPRPETLEKMRHARSPLSQFTQAEIETPGGTITAPRTQISPESFFLMPGITAEQVVKNLRTYKPAKEALITGESARRLYRRFKQLPQHILDYIDDLRYRTPAEEIKAYIDVPEDIVAMGAWSPKFFKDPKVKKFFERGAIRTGGGKPGEIVISPAGTKIQRGQLAEMGMSGRGGALLDEPLRTSLHEVGHGFEEMLRKSLTTKGAKWKLSPRLRGLELGMRKTGLSKDYPLGLGRAAEYQRAPHEQFARAFEESGLTEGYSLPAQVWQITGAPPPGNIYRRMLRDALRAAQLGKIP